VSVTAEAVAFDPPDRIGFRHLRGPVPHAVEEFLFRDDAGSTLIEYRGELGIDFWLLGRLAGRFWVAPTWEKAVHGSLEHIKGQAEERAGAWGRREEQRG
jgi:hypothetical protein